MEHTKGKVEVKQIEDLSIFELGFRVSTPDLLREIADNGLDIRMGMLKIPINELRRHLILLAELAIKIDNPELHIMMLRLGLYEDSNSDIENKIKQLQKEIKETKKANTNESGLTPSQLYKQNQELRLELENATGNVKKLLSISGLRDEDAEIYRIEIQRHLKAINHNKPLTTQKQNNDNQKPNKRILR